MVTETKAPSEIQGIVRCALASHPRRLAQPLGTAISNGIVPVIAVLMQGLALQVLLLKPLLWVHGTWSVVLGHLVAMHSCSATKV